MQPAREPRRSEAGRDAFTVLPPVSPCRPQPLRVAPRRAAPTRHRKASFVILAERQVVAPTRDPSPGGRVSPHRGRGFVPPPASSRIPRRASEPRLAPAPAAAAAAAARRPSTRRPPHAPSTRSRAAGATKSAAANTRSERTEVGVAADNSATSDERKNTDADIENTNNKQKDVSDDSEKRNNKINSAKTASHKIKNSEADTERIGDQNKNADIEVKSSSDKNNNAEMVTRKTSDNNATNAASADRKKQEALMSPSRIPRAVKGARSPPVRSPFSSRPASPGLAAAMSGAASGHQSAASGATNGQGAASGATSGQSAASGATSSQSAVPMATSGQSAVSGTTSGQSAATTATNGQSAVSGTTSGQSAATTATNGQSVASEAISGQSAAPMTTSGKSVPVAEVLPEPSAALVTTTTAPSLQLAAVGQPQPDPEPPGHAVVLAPPREDVAQPAPGATDTSPGGSRSQGKAQPPRRKVDAKPSGKASPRVVRPTKQDPGPALHHQQPVGTPVRFSETITEIPAKGGNVVNDIVVKGEPVAGTLVKGESITKTLVKGEAVTESLVKGDAELDTQSANNIISAGSPVVEACHSGAEQRSWKQRAAECLSLANCCSRDRTCMRCCRPRSSHPGRWQHCCSEPPSVKQCCRALLCLDAGCCRRPTCCCCGHSAPPPPQLDRRRSVAALSKKQSQASSQLPQEVAPKLDPSLVEHTSLIRGAIPVLPVPLAWICLFFNVFVPGLGTLSSGLLCLCFGKPRFSVRDDPQARVGACCLDMIVAVGQMFTILFCLVGWGWSIWWGVIMVKLAKKQKKIKLMEQQQQQAAPITMAVNHEVERV